MNIDIDRKIVDIIFEEVVILSHFKKNIQGNNIYSDLCKIKKIAFYTNTMCQKEFSDADEIYANLIRKTFVQQLIERSIGESMNTTLADTIK